MFDPIISQSTQYVRVLVNVSVDGETTPYNPSTDAIQFAFMTSNQDPDTTSWVLGSWASNIVDGQTQYIGRCLVGPGGVTTLAAGTYTVFVKITDDPEIPVLKIASQLVVT